MGDKVVKFEDENVRVGDISVPATTGLFELLFKMNPDRFIVTDADEASYKKILLHTKTHLHADGTVKFTNTHKYKKYIRRIMKPTGQGLVQFRARKKFGNLHNYGLNKLVERLALLWSSRDAGNTGLDSEIEAIVSHLRNEGIIA